jgi:hypothetical protein
MNEVVELLRSSFQKFSQAWFEHFGQASVASPTWAMDEATLGRAIVYWPAEYQWQPSSVFLDTLRLGIAKWAKVERRTIPQPYKGISIFHVGLNGKERQIAIDYSDYVDHIDRACLQGVSLYFKMQYLKAGYDMPEQERRKVIPGGYVTADRRLTPRLPAIRAAARESPPQFSVYGRFGLEFAKEIRTGVVEKLRGDPTLGYEGGLKKVPYRQSVMEASRSKICIDLPGNGDFCFRTLDYLSLGAFIIAYPHRTTLLSPLVDRHHLVYLKPDLSDVVPLCHYYLEHAAERLAIQNNAAEYFDKYCNYQQLGSWYLQQCLKLDSEPATH